MDLSFLKLLGGRAAGSRTLSTAISDAIENGQLLKGDRMPSSRELALFLGIARATVVTAYDDLISNGYLIGERGSGTYVSDKGSKVDAAIFGESKERFDWLALGNDQTRLLRQVPEQLNILGNWDPLNHGALPADLLPTKQWRKVIANQISEETTTMPHHYVDMLGYLQLRENIAVFLRRTQGIVCDPEQVVIFSSNQSALNHLFSLLVSPGDVAVCENPCYAGVREQFRLKGASVLTVPIDSDGIRTEFLPPKSDRNKFLYLTASHQDPTGVTLSLERRHKVLEWAQENNTCIIEDAWDTDFHYAGAPAPALMSLDKQGRVVYLYTFWKTLFPLVSTACLILPKELVPLFRAAKYVFDIPIPLIEHLALAEFIGDGELERHIRKVWKILRKRRLLLMHEMTRRFGSSVRIFAGGAGLHLVARFSETLSIDAIYAAADESHVPLTSTFECYESGAPANEFMVNFACIPEDEIASRIEEFGEKLALALA